MRSFRFPAGGRPCFLADQRGAAAMAFAIALPVVFLIVAGAVQYASVLRERSIAQNAADAASLAGMIAYGKNPATDETVKSAAAIEAAQSSFRSMADAMFPNVVVTAAVNKVGDAVSVSVEYQAPVSALVSSSAFPLTSFSGRSVSTATKGTSYIDVYVLIDTSQSMGLGADLADQKGMMANASINCSLACHGPENSPSTDTVQIAHDAGYKLRIDVIRDAVKNVIASAKASAGAGGPKVRIGLYTFDVGFHSLAAPTDDYATLTSIAEQIDIARWHAGTSTYYGLKTLSEAIGPTGDGSSASAPQTYVMFMSDGTVNASDNITATDWEPAATAFPPYNGQRCWPMDPPPDSGPYFPPKGDPISGACVPDPWTSTHSGNGQMQMQAINPDWCQWIKSKNAKLMTLYTDYVLLPASSTDPSNWMTNEWRFTFLDGYVIPKLKGAMQACASSPDLAFSGKDSAGITAAVDQMFRKALYSGVRLSL